MRIPRKGNPGIAAVLALAAVLSGCVTLGTPADVLEDMSWELLEFLPYESKDTIAVYYFLEDRRESPRSDYVLNLLGTGIANAIHEEERPLTLVSRTALDRILEEQSFQVSALADPGTQLLLGKQLGAQIIVTGTITPVQDGYEVNAQMIRVDTGAVLGGVVRTIYPE